MLGIVLAAGGGTRLRPLTNTIPKTLLPVVDDRTIFELAIANLRAVDITDVVVVTGFRAELVQDAARSLQARYGMTLHCLFNDRYADWNNAYSLWLARAAFRESALLINGDTVVPDGVAQVLLDARDQASIVLALDGVKQLGAEEMKVRLAPDGTVDRISKQLDPNDVDGEYIGLSLIAPAAAMTLQDALKTTFTEDPGLYYEDGYQELVRRGGEIRTAGIGDTAWVEVDDHHDLERARTIACQF
jgi:choline kinase